MTKTSLKLVGDTPAKRTIYIRERMNNFHPRNDNQERHAAAMLDQPTSFVLATGPAGTGRTYLSVLSALSLLHTKSVNQIIVCRPAVDAGEKLGFLPGDMKEKVDPFLMPVFNSYEQIIGHKPDEDTFTVIPLAFMRGRSLDNAVIILDEAQNTTELQMKMALTRVGENTRIFINGDTEQCDLPKGVPSGLNYLIETLAKYNGNDKGKMSTTIEYGLEDVVRSEATAFILKVFANAA